VKRYFECYVPTTTCNLRCHYCYITQSRQFDNKIAEIPYSAGHIRKALSRERLGGECLFNFCAGGETLLADIVPYIAALLAEGHYCTFVTNGLVTKRIEEFAALDPALLGRLMFKFSFHYLELKRTNQMDRFFDNINRMKKAGASFTVEITPSDELVPHIDDVKAVCMKKLGALCHVTIARLDTDRRIPVLSRYPFEEYQKIWGAFDSPLFDFKAVIFYKKRREFCYAGDWSCYLNLGTGDLSQCYFGSFLQNIYRDVEAPIRFAPIGTMCRYPHCFNGHSFLTLGVIPELDTPSYCALRDRAASDGEAWLREPLKSFISGKLKDSNSELSNGKKRTAAIKNVLLLVRNKTRWVWKRAFEREAE
jgi:organic radical activating enzyme